jgi:hypothetical protein
MLMELRMVLGLKEETVNEREKGRNNNCSHRPPTGGCV